MNVDKAQLLRSEAKRSWHPTVVTVHEPPMRYQLRSQPAPHLTALRHGGHRAERVRVQRQPPHASNHQRDVETPPVPAEFADIEVRYD